MYCFGFFRKQSLQHLISYNSFRNMNMRLLQVAMCEKYRSSHFQSDGESKKFEDWGGVKYFRTGRSYRFGGGGVLQLGEGQYPMKRCSQKFRKILRKTIVSVSFLIKLQKFSRTPFLRNTSRRLPLLKALLKGTFSWVSFKQLLLSNCAYKNYVCTTKMLHIFRLEKRDVNLGQDGKLHIPFKPTCCSESKLELRKTCVIFSLTYSIAVDYKLKLIVTFECKSLKLPPCMLLISFQPLVSS